MVWVKWVVVSVHKQTFKTNKLTNIQTKLRQIWYHTCLFAARDVLVKVWPGFVGPEGIWPTGVTCGLYIWDMNCFVKSSALVAAPALSLFRILSQLPCGGFCTWVGGAVGGAGCFCWGGGVGPLKKIKNFHFY